VQEALYGALNERLREEYHAGIASALETQHGAAAEDPAALDGALCVDLAEHLLHGAQGARALRYLDPALTHLEKGYLNDAAVRLGERALAVPELLTGSARASVLLRVVARLDFLGRRDRQLAAAEEALAAARASGDRTSEAAALGNLGAVSCTLGRLPEALELLERQLALARATGNRRGEILATGSLSVVCFSLGRFAESLEHSERQLALARESGDRTSEAQATANLGLAFAALGRFPEARERYERCVALTREIGDRRGEALATGNLGVALKSLGRLAAAREHQERRIALSREIGDRQGETHATGNLGIVCIALGLLAEARTHLERWIELAREVGDRRGEALAVGNLGTLLWTLGRLGEAQEHAERWLASTREIGDRRQEGYALGTLAGLAEESGESALAERGFADAIDLLGAIGARSELADMLSARGALLARTGRIDAARADLEAARSLAVASSAPSAELAALTVLATLPGGDVGAALAALAAHGGRTEVRTLVEVRNLLWQATRDRAHLVEAKRLLDDLVAHAPPEDRESMLANVRTNREIVEACKAEGL
jgi:tetratricopeptide (TPR) repeat protein